MDMSEVWSKPVQLYTWTPEDLAEREAGCDSEQKAGPSTALRSAQDDECEMRFAQDDKCELGSAQGDIPQRDR